MCIASSLVSSQSCIEKKGAYCSWRGKPKGIFRTPEKGKLCIDLEKNSNRIQLAKETNSQPNWVYYSHWHWHISMYKSTLLNFPNIAGWCKPQDFPHCTMSSPVIMDLELCGIGLSKRVWWGTSKDGPTLTPLESFASDKILAVAACLCLPNHVHCCFSFHSGPCAPGRRVGNKF